MHQKNIFLFFTIASKMATVHLPFYFLMANISHGFSSSIFFETINTFDVDKFICV